MADNNLRINISNQSEKDNSKNMQGDRVTTANFTTLHGVREKQWDAFVGIVGAQPGDEVLDCMVARGKPPLICLKTNHKQSSMYKIELQMQLERQIPT